MWESPGSTGRTMFIAAPMEAVTPMESANHTAGFHSRRSSATTSGMTMSAPMTSTSIPR